MFINQREAEQLIKEILHRLQVLGVNTDALTEGQARQVAIDILWQRGGTEWNGDEWVIDRTELWKDGRRVA